MKTWERLDLQGGGLQDANIRLARRLKKPLAAYLLWCLFPLGAHAIYLGYPWRALVYTGASAATAILYLATGDALALLPLAAAFLLALYDLMRMRRWIIERNKQIRVGVYLSRTPGAPEGFKGRFDDDSLAEHPTEKERKTSPGIPLKAERRWSTPGHAPSFAEQEATLRELAKKSAKP